MKFAIGFSLCLAGLLHGQAPPAKAVIDAGGENFIQQCAFCHGRDAGGGEEGPDLTRSTLVGEDKNGDKIGPVVRNGRVEHGMPRFNVNDGQLAELVAFIHNQKKVADARVGQRRGVDAADLQTGNAEAGKRYFNGAGKCNSCHSPTGDLAGFAKRFEGLKLFQRFLYPKGAKAFLTVTTAKGEVIKGELAYQDEFNVALTDSNGSYRGFPVKSVRIKVDAPAEAHADLLSKYTEADLHNVLAYLQTLK